MGALRGESIPVKISIKHTKPVKSLHGIIVTLVRVGRFDTFPISANGLNSKGSASSLKKGLYLGSGGGTTTFRKDLSQVIAPLIVDPNTLTAVVWTTVRVPEDSFPSINSVPGQIVSFKYFVEVLVDLGGKLAGKEDFLNGVGMVNIPAATTGELGGVEAKLGNGDTSGMMAVYGAKVIETEKIRRDVKNVVSCRFEVTVGTTNSRNGKGRRREANISNFINLSTQDTNLTCNAVGGRGHRHPGYDYDHMRTIIIPDAMVDTLLTPPPPPSPPVQIALSPIPAFPEDRRVAISTPPTPPPDMGNLDEKTRLRMAEQALLPSAPPGFGEAAASSSADASAPIREAHAYASAPHSPLPSAPPLAIVDGEDFMHPSAPPMGMGRNLDVGVGLAYFHNYRQPQSTELAQAGNEDKQELERQRLLAAASAPPLPESGSGDASGSGVGTSALPTAPALCEDLDGELPRYQR